MDGNDITVYRASRRSPNTPREVFGIFFRHRRLVAVSFLATFGGVAIATLLFGIKYRAHTEILVKRERPAAVVSTNENSPEQPPDDQARAREINTEVELLNSYDLLAQIVKSSHLDGSGNHFWSGWLPSFGQKDAATEKAVRKLSRKLSVSPVPDSNIIEVSYTSRNPEQAAQVLRNLDKLYIAKHVAVNRPPGVTDFFQTQTEQFQNQLSTAESSLASFDLQKNAASPELEKEILLRKASEFDGELQEAHADIAQTQRRIQALEGELASTPDRLSTQQTILDNAQLMANLKSSLQDLETKRTDLLEKYQPGYRPVKEVEKQISQVQAAIRSAEQNPLREVTTDQNPTHELLQSELAKQKAELASLHAKTAATAPIVATYTKQALLLDQKDIQRQDLMRAVKTSEQNYLLYLNKYQQARISDALDTRRILNVAVAEAATVPALPVNSPWLLILAGGVLALLVSSASAFASDYFDQSFRTPDEVIRYLDMPVLAAFPKNGHAPRFRLPAASMGALKEAPFSASPKKRPFARRRQESD